MARPYSRSTALHAAPAEPAGARTTQSARDVSSGFWRGLAALTGLVLALVTDGVSAAPAWRELEPGLELGVFEAQAPSPEGDRLVRVVRIDPKHFELRLLNASDPAHGEALTAKAWSERHALVAAINAGMYATDHRTSIALMRSRTHVNNARLTSHRAVLAFDRANAKVPAFQIIDLECQDFEQLEGMYGTLVQSIRMISCDRRNVWKQQPKRWSTAAIGSDGQGRILFIHVRSPYSTHDLINVLLELPLDLRRALYAEGGSEAQLFVKSGDFELELIGSHGSSLLGDATGMPARTLPNVIGVARKAR